MTQIQHTSGMLVLKEGATTLTLNKSAGKATLQRRMLLWNRKAVEFPLAEIDDISVIPVKDKFSGAPLYHAVLHRRSGETTILTTEEAKESAATTVEKLRSFVGL